MGVIWELHSGCVGSILGLSIQDYIGIMKRLHRGGIRTI